MKLVLAEKPMLATAIAAAIDGKEEKKDGYIIKGEYTIVSAFGHLLTLKDPEDYDEKFRKWSFDTLPIYFENWGKKPGAGKEERLLLIGKLLKDADLVIHAGDPDDEGQYLIDEILEWFNYKGKVLRLSTGDTTEGALRKALASMKDNSEFVNAGLSAHARSVADIMVGYNMSRYFSLNNMHVKMLTVGRVQTPTLGLVVTRDMQIENHAKQLYYTIKSDLRIEDSKIRTDFEPLKDDPNLEEGRITDKDYADEIAEGLKGSDIENIKISRKEVSEQPPLPFNLVKLQTYCSNKFGYDPSKTLDITQHLRDDFNAITYNRSDCQYLSTEQYKESPATLKQVLSNLSGDPAGKVFEKLNINTKLKSSAFNDKNITAHTAIIPQNKKVNLEKLSEDQRNVYLAIVKYFVAQFLEPAKKEKTSLEAKTEFGNLKAYSTKILSNGYLSLIRPEKDDDEEENTLSLLEPGVYDGSCEDAFVKENETKAPPRYTKASLNEDMTRIARYVTDPKAKTLLLSKDKDKKGENGSIGTSATRSTIIDNLELRGFIETKGKSIQSTQLGRELYRILPDELKKPDMTGLWWAYQSQIQDGEAPWTELTDSVLEMIRKVIKTSYPKVDAYHVPEDFRKGKLILGKCPRCGKDILEGQLSYSCSGYRDGCTFSIWKEAKGGLLQKTYITADMVHELLEEPWIDEVKEDESGNKAPTGRKRSPNSVLVKRLYSEKTKASFSAELYLADDEKSPYGPSFTIERLVREEPKVLGKCPRCGGDVIEGKLAYGCKNYANGCKFTIWKKAKSGMMSKAKITKGLVKLLLSSEFIQEEREDENGNMVLTGKMRTKNTVHIRRLYSENKGRVYSGDVYLIDEGPASMYGAGFGLDKVTNDAPPSLGKCPRCGNDVFAYDSFYGCSGYKDGCRFAISKENKAGMLSKTRITKKAVKELLNSPWIDEVRADESGNPVKTGRKRSEKTIHIKRLYSEAKNKIYQGDVYLADEGKDSKYGPSFMIERLTNDPLPSLGKCPRCGGDITEGKDGFGCSNYKDGCRFIIWKKAKAGLFEKETITKTLVKNLLSDGYIDEVKNGKETGRKRTKNTAHFTKIYSKTKDQTYTADAYIADDSTYGAVFEIDKFTDDGPEVIGTCPRCGKKIFEEDNGFKCENYKSCKFSIWKNSNMKLLSDVTFTKTDAKKFLSGKLVKKSKLRDKKNQSFTANLIMEERADNPYGPVFRVVEGSIEVKDGDPSSIRIDTVKEEDIRGK